MQVEIVTKALDGVFRSKVIETVVYSCSFSLMTIGSEQNQQIEKDFLLTPKVLDQIADEIPRQDFNQKETVLKFVV